MINKYKEVKTKIIPYLVGIGGYTVNDPLDSGTVGPQPTGTLGFWVSRTLVFILPIVGMIGFVFFLWSGIQFLTSKGDPKALEAAKSRLTFTIIGLVVIFLSYAITTFFTNAIGLGTP